MDMHEIAKMCGVSYEEVHKTSCGKFTMGDVTIQIMSPSNGHFTSMTNMTSEENKKLLASGESAAEAFIAKNQLGIIEAYYFNKPINNSQYGGCFV